MQKLEVIPGGAKEKRSYKPGALEYNGALLRMIEKMCAQNGDLSTMDDLKTEDLKKVVYLYVKSISTTQTKELDTYGDLFVTNVFTQIEWTVSIFAQMTPRQIMTMFPVEKYYKGHRYESKDYFTTMAAINEIGLDNVIGEERIPHFLMDYMNPDIDEFMVVFMLTVCRMSILQKGKDPMDEFFEKSGITTYNYNEEAGILTNCQTGEVTKVEKPKTRIPKYMEVIEGGLNE